MHWNLPIRECYGAKMLLFKGSLLIPGYFFKISKLIFLEKKSRDFKLVQSFHKTHRFLSNRINFRLFHVCRRQKESKRWRKAYDVRVRRKQLKRNTLNDMYWTIWTIEFMTCRCVFAWFNEFYSGCFSTFFYLHFSVVFSECKNELNALMSINTLL